MARTGYRRRRLCSLGGGLSEGTQDTQKREQLLDNNIGTIQDYIHLLQWFMSYIENISSDDESYILHRNMTVNQLRASISLYQS